MKPITFLESKGLSITKAAREMGVSTTTLSRPLKGERWPSEHVLVRFHELSGGEVSLADWIDTCRDLLERQGILSKQTIEEK